MRIAITGATGFLGRPLVGHLHALGHECIALTRDPARAQHAGFPRDVAIHHVNDLPEAEAVIHLAGENPAALWTPWKRRKIFNSRVDGTLRLIAAMQKLRRPPHTFLSASAIGYYGDRPGVKLTECSRAHPCCRFRSRVCVAWEAAAEGAEALGARVVSLRLGNVMDLSGGFLARLVSVYRAVGCLVLGSASSHLSWIALPDAVNLIAFAVENQSLSGPLNIVAPNAITQHILAHTLARRLGLTVGGRLPAPLLRLVLGELSSALIEDQNVIPKRAMDAGFQFAQPAWRSCLDALFGEEIPAKRSLSRDPAYHPITR